MKRINLSRAVWHAAAAASLLLVAAGCSSDKKASPTTTEPATVASTADSGTSATSPSGGGTPTPDTGNSTTPPWQRNATAHAGEIGKSFSLDCPANGTLGNIWGTETYTDDSSICSAAVHVGLITVEQGGAVVYQMAAGEDSYAGMEGHGVTSQAYGVWPVSFIFPEAPPGSGTFTASIATWDQNASAADLKVGDKIVVGCSTGGHLGSVWGTDIYTSDSSICSAAVLQGLITVDKGGIVVAQIVPGAKSYTGSTKNGVTSQDYGSWDRSFAFPADQKPPTTKG